MAIQLEDEVKPGFPVVKRTALGQKFFGAVVKVEQRDRLKKDEATGAMTKMLKPGTDKARQELVVTCVVLPGTTAPVGLGDDEHDATEGEIVRLILRGKAFGDWIETKAELGRPIQVGDVVTQATEYAQVYDAQGNATGSQITDQATLNAVPRGKSVGIYGDLSVRAPKPNSRWITVAEEAYYSLQTPIAAEETSAAASSDDDEEVPF